jgi:general secretion pathway protein I
VRFSKGTWKLQSGNRTGGFTLLEVLVAVAVLATALVSLLSLHGKNIQTIAYDQRLARATLLAQDVLARTLVADPFPDPAQTSGDFPDGDYHWQVEILRGPTREVEDYVREIRVRVFWNVNDPDAVTLATFVGKPEL